MCVINATVLLSVVLVGMHDVTCWSQGTECWQGMRPLYTESSQLRKYCIGQESGVMKYSFFFFEVENFKF